jgi:hypothetical protein
MRKRIEIKQQNLETSTNVSVRDRIRNGERINSTLKPPAEIFPITASFEIKDIINHWESLGLRRIRSPKVYNKTIHTLKKVLAGNFFLNTRLEHEVPRFSTDDIRRSMLRFSKAALSIDYEPIVGKSKIYLRRISIIDFIYNPMSPFIQSQLLYFHNNRPKYLSDKFLPVVTPTNPQLAVRIKEMYLELSGRSDLNQQEIDRLIVFSNKLDYFFKNTFCKSNAVKGSMLPSDYLDVFEESIISALQEAYPNDLEARCNNLNLFAGDWVINSRLPEYLHRQGLLDSRNN